MSMANTCKAEISSENVVLFGMYHRRPYRKRAILKTGVVLKMISYQTDRPRPTTETSIIVSQMTLEKRQIEINVSPTIMSHEVDFSCS